MHPIFLTSPLVPWIFVTSTYGDNLTLKDKLVWLFVFLSWPIRFWERNFVKSKKTRKDGVCFFTCLLSVVVISWIQLWGRSVFVLVYCCRINFKNILLWNSGFCLCVGKTNFILMFCKGGNGRLCQQIAEIPTSYLFDVWNIQLAVKIWWQISFFS